MTGPPDTDPSRTAEQTKMGRRWFLASAGSLGAVLLAGCLGDDGDSGSESDDSGSNNGTSIDDSGSDDNDSNDGSDGDNGHDDTATLERRAREIIELQAGGSFEAAHDRLVGDGRRADRHPICGAIRRRVRGARGRAAPLRWVRRRHGA
jgi:hypothetical protein